VRGGPQAPGATITGWSVEAFIPFALLRGLGGTPPVNGDRWRMNLYRIDTDLGPGRSNHWAWAAVPGQDFHHLPSFGTAVFA
jgi:hypothetical protein